MKVKHGSALSLLARIAVALGYRPPSIAPFAGNSTLESAELTATHATRTTGHGAS